MEIKTIEVSGFASALKALRLPYNKGTRSEIYDNNIYCYEDFWDISGQEGVYTKKLVHQCQILFSPDDIKLMQTLIERGDSHAKPVRGVLAYVDIIAPIHFWGELETYRAGHERLFSASTMNTEGKALKGKELAKTLHKIPFDRPIHKIDFFSYQCLRNIVRQRYNHRKTEWHEFIEWIKTLPMAEELILCGLDEELKVHDEMYREMV